MFVKKIIKLRTQSPNDSIRPVQPEPLYQESSNLWIFMLALELQTSFILHFKKQIFRRGCALHRVTIVPGRTTKMLLFCAKVVTLTKKWYQCVLSLQGAQLRKVEQSDHRPESRNTPLSPKKNVCAEVCARPVSVCPCNTKWYVFSSMLRL